jgi:hypothetical protein
MPRSTPKLSYAADWLMCEFENCSALAARLVRLRAEAAGIAPRTLQRAAKALDVRFSTTAQFPAQGIWHLSPDDL